MLINQISRSTIIIVLLLILRIKILSAQIETWVMGYHNGINDTSKPCGKFELRFEKGKEPIAKCSFVNNELNMLSSESSISDSLGNIIFYFDSYRIADQNHQIIENGEGINFGEVRNNYVSYPMKNGVVIIPDLSHKNKWYIFHQYLELLKNHPSGAGLLCTKLLQTVVERDNKTNKLKVITKNEEILKGPFIIGHLNASRHANGRDCWILTQGFNSANYITLLLTTEGLKGPWIQSIGPAPYIEDWNGNSTFSRDGTLYASSIPNYYIQILNFDRCSGILTNPRFIYNEQVKELGQGYIEFSPDNHYLYVSSIYSIWQYDLSSTFLNGKFFKVGTWDSTYYKNNFSNAFYTMALTIDDKIYISCYSSNVHIHRINFPNNRASSCEFEQRAITLPEYYVGLNNVESYYLGALIGSPCDTIVSSINKIDKQQINLTNNPVSNNLNFSYHKKVKVQIINLNGAVLIETIYAEPDVIMMINVDNIPSGTYFLKILDYSNSIPTLKFIKI